MGKTVLGFSLVGVSVVVGFAIGFGIGQQTRKAAPSHVTTSFSGGTVTIKANIGGALERGVASYLGLV